jgi:hypothetical protein
MLRAHSATAIAAPSCGWSCTKRPLQSTESARYFTMRVLQLRRRVVRGAEHADDRGVALTGAQHRAVAHDVIVLAVDPLREPTLGEPITSSSSLPEIERREIRQGVASPTGGLLGCGRS